MSGTTILAVPGTGTINSTQTVRCEATSHATSSHPSGTDTTEASVVSRPCVVLPRSSTINSTRTYYTVVVLNCIIVLVLHVLYSSSSERALSLTK